MMMNEEEIMRQIGMLVNERHELLQKAQRYELEDGGHERIKAIAVELEHSWDMVRRYRTKRANGLEPDAAKVA
jgi:hypothetical protein